VEILKMLSENILKAESWKNSLSIEDKEYVHTVLSKLPQDSRVIIFLRYWRDFEFEDIAKTLGIALSEVFAVHDLTIQLLSKTICFNKKPMHSQTKEAA